MTCRTIIPPLLVLSVTGCTALPRQPGFADVASIANARSGARVYWNQQTAADRQVEQRVHELLSRPVGADEAVRALQKSLPTAKVFATRKSRVPPTASP